MVHHRYRLQISTEMKRLGHLDNNLPMKAIVFFSSTRYIGFIIVINWLSLGSYSNAPALNVISCNNAMCHVTFDMFAYHYIGNLAYNIFRGPIEVVLGVAIGVIIGPLLWILPCKHKVGDALY